MKIFLMGYMGSGKSTVGKKLARKLQLDFLDLDTYIENRTGKKIAQLFDSEGEKQFRSLENKSLKELLYKDNIVIALGGGTPCFHNNIKLINKNGISVYLDIKAETLVKQLSKEKNKRPLIRGMNNNKLKLFIKINLEKRRMFYSQAHYIIKEKKMQGIKDRVQEIIKAISIKKNMK